MYGFNLSFSFPHLQQSLTPASGNLLSHLSTIVSELKAKLKLAQETAKLKYDHYQAPAPTFNIGDLVMLSHQNIKMMHPSDEFDYWKLGHSRLLTGLVIMLMSWSFQKHYPDFTPYSISTSSNLADHCQLSQTTFNTWCLYWRWFWKGKTCSNSRTLQMFERLAITLIIWWNSLISPFPIGLGFHCWISQTIAMSPLSIFIVITLHNPGL